MLFLFAIFVSCILILNVIVENSEFLFISVYITVTFVEYSEFVLEHHSTNFTDWNECLQFNHWSLCDLHEVN